MIPKIIHYCWFGNNPIPYFVKKCIESWEKYCPEYKIIQWNETNFDINSNPYVKSAYENKAWAFVSDYVRLKIIYDNGGVYLDTDVELLRNIDFLLEYDCFVSIEQSKHLCNTGLGFGAVKSNRVVQHMLSKYNGLVFSRENIKDFLCPYLNTSAIVDLGYSYSEEVQHLPEFVVFPPRYFDPIAPGDITENLLCKDTISIHHYSASWTSKYVQAKRMILRLIDAKWVMRLKRLKRYLHVTNKD